MFGTMFKVRPHNKKKARPAFPLRIEQLEGRDCPSGGPLSASLLAEVLPGHQVHLSGSVTGEGGAGISLAFGGSATGSTITDANGYFSFTTSQASLGMVSVAADGMDIGWADIAVARPSIAGVAISYGAAQSVTVTGILNSIDAAGQTISFSGVASGTATTDSTGYFSFTAIAEALGMIHVSETDLWGQNSDVATVMVESQAPTILDFHAENESGDIWILSGSVDDEYAPGTIITLWGAPFSQPIQVTVAEDGTFWTTCTYSVQFTTAVYARATDSWGLESETAIAFLFS